MLDYWAWKFCNDPITRFLTLRHKKPWKIKKMNKRLASNGLRAIRSH